MATEAYLSRVSTAVPDHQVHAAFLTYAHGMLRDERSRALFLRMAERSGIAQRYSVMSVTDPPGTEGVNAHAFYRADNFPFTAQRMQLYKRFAPLLMQRALERLALSQEERGRIRHVIVTTCTGFYAPGLDFDAVRFLGLDPGVERTMIGFMGCYAAMNALKLARHIVRSTPEHDVLIVNLELCTLHLQQTQDLGEVLSFLIFGDGCAASVVTARQGGLRLTGFQAVHLPNTEDLITWHVGDQGFDMVLSGQVPLAVGDGLRERRAEFGDVDAVQHWAVHPGGRSVLDAVQDSLSLPEGALAASRQVLHDFGNMSSATVMFVLQSVLQRSGPGEHGCAMSFGPGMVAETMRFVTE